MYARSEEKQDIALLRGEEESQSENHTRDERCKHNWPVILLSLTNLILLAALCSHSSFFLSKPSSPSPPPPTNNEAAPPTTPPLIPILHSTEIADAAPYIHYEQRPFTGELGYNTTSHTLYRELDPTQPQYFGAPSPALDAAWSALLHNEYIPMHPSEALSYASTHNTTTGSGSLTPINGAILMEPTFMHALHCLNALRKKIDHEYYGSKRSMWRHYPAEFERTHDDHCLEFVMQSVLCAADLTPSLMWRWEGFGMAVGRTGMHTCRAREGVEEWMRGRKGESERAGV